jgi:hypothetical protein
MRTQLILGLVVLCIASAAFVAGMLVERHYPTLFAASNVPKLLSPDDGAVLNKHDPQVWEFTWSKVPRAERYQFFIAHSSDINHPVGSQEVEVPFYRLPYPHLFQGEDPYRKGWTWKVRAQVAGEWSKWSEVRTFDIEPKAR